MLFLKVWVGILASIAITLPMIGGVVCLNILVMFLQLEKNGHAYGATEQFNHIPSPWVSHIYAMRPLVVWVTRFKVSQMVARAVGSVLTGPWARDHGPGSMGPHGADPTGYAACGLLHEGYPMDGRLFHSAWQSSSMLCACVHLAGESLKLHGHSAVWASSSVFFLYVASPQESPAFTQGGMGHLLGYFHVFCRTFAYVCIHIHTCALSRCVYGT